MVASTIVLVFEARDSVMEGNFAGQPALGEQFQGPINGGEPDLRIPFSYKLIELIGREVFPRFQECEQNGVALLGVLEPDFFQVTMEYLLRVAQRLARNRGVIVNSLLQHSMFGEPFLYVKCPDASKTSGTFCPPFLEIPATNCTIQQDGHCNFSC